jgi:putative spermidine/putrescine transport system substrate-binding protein
LESNEQRWVETLDSRGKGGNIMRGKRISRRSFLKGSVAAAGVLAGSGPLVLLPRKGQAAADKGPVVFCTYGGPYGENMQKYIIDPFIKKTGIEVIRTSTPRFAKVKAMVDTGNVEWDVVDAEARVFFRGLPLNLFEPLDWTVIGHEDELVTGGVEPMGAGNVYYHIVLGWHTSKYNRDTAPKSWADFFSFSGKRTTRNEAYETLEIALLADGVPKAELYPLDVERALKKLSTVKNDIIFWAATKMALDLLVSNEVDFGAVTGGPVQKTIEAGEPIDFTWNQALVGNDYLVVPKGSKQKGAAMKFIGHCMDPEAQGAFSTHYYMGPSNTRAFDFMPPGRDEVLCTGPKIRPLTVSKNAQYWAENEEELSKRFEQWMTS